MRYFLTLLVLITFFSANSQVVIKEDVARYFLERSELAKVLGEQVEIKNKRISNLEQTIAQKDKLISSYKSDSADYNKIIVLKDQQLKFANDKLKLAEKEARKQKRLKKLAIVGTVVVVVLALMR